MNKNIGLTIIPPKLECNDKHCPFHGKLSVRGKLFEGNVVSVKAKNMVVVQREAPVYMSKFKRYARSKSSIHVYAPSCITLAEGDRVVAAECRLLAKSVSFVIVEAKK